MESPVCQRPTQNGELSGLRPNTHRGELPGAWGPLEAPLDDCAVVSAEFCVLSLFLSLSLSLSMEEGRSTFRGVARILAKF